MTSDVLGRTTTSRSLCAEGSTLRTCSLRLCLWWSSIRIMNGISDVQHIRGFGSLPIFLDNVKFGASSAGLRKAAKTTFVASCEQIGHKELPHRHQGQLQAFTGSASTTPLAHSTTSGRTPSTTPSSMWSANVSIYYIVRLHYSASVAVNHMHAQQRWLLCPLASERR